MSKRPERGVSAEHKDRLSRCRQAFKKLGADAFLITNDRDYFYLTGFTGEDAAVLMTTRDLCIVTDRRFEEQVVTDCPWARVRLRTGLLNPELVAACREMGVKKLAVDADHMTMSTHAELHKALRGVRLLPSSGLVGDLRVRKSPGEVRGMVKAIRVAEAAFEATRKSIRVGQTERQMAAQLEYEMTCRGASGPSFSTICAEGLNAALPHAHPGQRKVKPGSAILFDWGACVGGYRSDLTRVLFVGSISRRLNRVYDVVLEAQLAAIRALRPGQRMCDIDAVARGVIIRAGFGDQFSHGLGHGLGLDVHERPSLSWRSSAKLEPGMLVTVEPGIYLPGFGGIRIEDDVLITPTGKRVLSQLDKTLKGAVIRVRK